jgi:hypothetical protein
MKYSKLKATVEQLKKAFVQTWFKIANQPLKE